MSRPSISGLLLVTLLTGAMLAGRLPSVTAQEGSPEAGPPGMEVDNLFSTTLYDLPPAPLPAALARITFDPGSGLSMTANPGPALHFVEEGSFDVLMTGGGTLVPSATPATEQIVAPGEEFSIVPGDLLVIPADTPFEVFNNDTTPAVALIIEFFPRDLSAPLPPGIALQPLVVGEAMESIDGAAVLNLSRVTLAPNAGLRDQTENGGPALLYAENGVAAYSIVRGSARIAYAAHDSATPVVPPAGAEDVPAGAEVPFEAGDAVFEQSGTERGLRNAGGAPLNYLILTIFPEDREMAMPGP